MIFADSHHSDHLWLTVVVVGLLFWGYRLRRQRLKLFVSEKLLPVVVPSLSLKRRFWRSVLTVCILLLLVLAYMRPQYGVIFQNNVRRGQDIYIALDISASMAASDVKPSRLAHAKREILELITLLEGDRIGLIVFSGEAFIQCPLTMDYSALRLYLDDVTVGSISVPGTDLATAIKMARVSFKSSSQRTRKILVVLSDGESFENDPVESARVAADEGVQIFTVGLGSTSGEPVPEHDETGQFIGYKKDKSSQVVLSKLNEPLLKEVASVAEGTYFSSTEGVSAMSQIYQQVSTNEKSDMVESSQKSYQDRYRIFLFMAFLLMCVDFVLSDRHRGVAQWKGRLTE